MISEQLYDIYGMWYVPLWQRWWWPILTYGIGVIFSSIMIGVAVLAYRKCVRKKTPAWVNAMQKITSLQKTISEDTARIVYSQTIVILKEYLQQRYNVPLVGKTDIEVAAMLQDSTLPAHIVTHVCAIVDRSTEIKFGTDVIDVARVERDLTNALYIIRISAASSSQQQ